MNFVVSTDAAADLDSAYIKKHDVKVISMRFTLDGTEYSFGNGESGIAMSDLFRKLEKGAIAKTQLINVHEHTVHFEKFLEKGQDVLHIPLSSGLSGTAEHAKQAAEALAQKYKDKKVVVIDFRGASMGQGLFVDYLVNMRNDGKTLDEATVWAQEDAMRFCHYFTVDDLKHLRRGGRISGFSSFVGSLLKIKPLLHVNNDGKLIPLQKTRGRTKALDGLVEKMKELADGKPQRVFICHAESEADARKVANNITAKLGITDIVIGRMGPIIGLHAGPGTIALFFVGKHR